MRGISAGTRLSRRLNDPAHLAESKASGHAARSLRSRPYAGEGLGWRSLQQEDGSGSRPSAGPAARGAFDVTTDRGEVWKNHRETFLFGFAQRGIEEWALRVG